jgi:hypothetical protein
MCAGVQSYLSFRTCETLGSPFIRRTLAGSGYDKTGMLKAAKSAPENAIPMMHFTAWAGRKRGLETRLASSTTVIASGWLAPVLAGADTEPNLSLLSPSGRTDPVMVIPAPSVPPPVSRRQPVQRQAAPCHKDTGAARCQAAAADGRQIVSAAPRRALTKGDQAFRAVRRHGGHADEMVVDDHILEHDRRRARRHVALVGPVLLVIAPPAHPVA